MKTLSQCTSHLLNYGKVKFAKKKRKKKKNKERWNFIVSPKIDGPHVHWILEVLSPFSPPSNTAKYPYRSYIQLLKE